MEELLWKGKKILAGYGITEKNMGVSIKATMDVAKIGEMQNGLAVYFDKYAFQADGIIAVNRIKVHTAYSGNTRTLFPVTSGQHSGIIRTPCRIIK